jgi:hypothetical protein
VPASQIGVGAGPHPAVDVAPAVDGNRGKQARYSAARRDRPVKFDTRLSVPDGELSAKSIHGCAREPGRPRLAIQVPERRDKPLLRQRVSVKREPANRGSASFGRPVCRHRLRHHRE